MFFDIDTMPAKLQLPYQIDMKLIQFKCDCDAAVTTLKASFTWCVSDSVKNRPHQKQECIPVGCVPPACWPYPSMHRVGVVYPSMHWAGGVCPGGVCRGCLPSGVCPGGSAGGGSAWGVTDTHQTRGRHPLLWTEWQIGVKTLPCRNFLAGGNDLHVCCSRSHGCKCLCEQAHLLP